MDGRGDRKLLTLLLLGFSLGIWAAVNTSLHDAILTLALEFVLEFVLELAHAGVLVVNLHAFRAIATLEGGIAHFDVGSALRHYAVLWGRY